MPVSAAGSQSRTPNDRRHRPSRYGSQARTPLNRSSALPGRCAQERIVFLQLLVDLPSERGRQVHGGAVFRGLAEHRPIPFQFLKGALEARDMIGRESTEEVILEHVVLPEHPVTVELVQDRGFFSRDIPQVGGNRTRSYK